MLISLNGQTNGNTELLFTIFCRSFYMVRSIKGSLLDEVDVITYSEYMQTLSSGYLEDTTNIQADLEVDAEAYL